MGVCQVESANMQVHKKKSFEITFNWPITLLHLKLPRVAPSPNNMPNNGLYQWVLFLHGNEASVHTTHTVIIKTP